MDDLRVSLRLHAISREEISGSIGSRFHIDRLPETVTMPCIRLRTVNDTPMTNRSAKGLGRAVYQLEAYSEDTMEATQIVLALLDVYDGYQGAIGSFDVRILARDIPGDWQPDPRLFMRMVEMDIGYVG